MKDFEEMLDFGKKAEFWVEKYLLKKGWYILPVEPLEGRGQKVYSKNGENNSPDFLAFHTKRGTRWVEVKRRTKFTFFQTSWYVGISKKDISDYLKIQEVSGIPVYIFFFVHPDTDFWGECPSGIYSDSLENLMNLFSSETNDVYYWKYNVLSKIQEAEDLD